MFINDVLKYGNDDDYVDDLIVEVYKLYIDEIVKYKNMCYGCGFIGGLCYVGIFFILVNVG